MVSATRGSRNSELARGVQRLSRSAMYKKRSTWRYTKGAKPDQAKKAAVTEKKVRAEARYYRADDIKRKLRSRKGAHKQTRLRSSIKPGQVLIILAGRFRGKRVVFLKQLQSGLLLVTGPFKINGVPLRRLNQSYVVATSTQVDLAGADFAAVTDAIFVKDKKKKTKDAEGFFAKDEEKNELPAEKKAMQKSVDAAVLKAVAGVDQLRAYLKARFTLSKGQYPHEMAF
eukprot:158413_1